MAQPNDLMLYVVKVPGGQFHLMTEEGTVILEADSWRALRRDLGHVFDRHSDRPADVILCVGNPRPAPRPSPSQIRERLVLVEQHAAP
jgi:hypothetical protein